MASGVKVVGTVFFSIDITSLGVLLTLLWTMSKTSLDCERMCLPDIHGQSSCKLCRANSLQNYLTWNFNQQFDKLNTNLKKQYQHLPLKDYTEARLSSMKPNARLGGNKEEIVPDKDESNTATKLVPLRSWRHDGNDMFMQNGLTYRNGRIVIPFQGMYHIYSFLDLDVDETFALSKSDNASIQFSIYKSNILRHGTDEEEEELIGTFKPFEKKKRPYTDSYNTFISADVLLDPGDEVYIKVCNRKFIKYPTKNWFGIHLL